jgi:hypothetical protein
MNREIAEQYNKHRKMVEKVANELRGIMFTKAPFDIIDERKQFYEIKVVGARKGRHSSECRINVSENELKFGEIFGDKLTYIIFFKENKYIIPFKDLEQRIKANKPTKSALKGALKVTFQPCLSQKFLSKFKQ